MVLTFSEKHHRTHNTLNLEVDYSYWLWNNMSINPFHKDDSWCVKPEFSFFFFGIIWAWKSSIQLCLELFSLFSQALLDNLEVTVTVKKVWLPSFSFEKLFSYDQLPQKFSEVSFMSTCVQTQHVVTDPLELAKALLISLTQEKKQPCRPPLHKYGAVLSKPN